MQAKRLSDDPFDAISLHGPSDLPVHTDSNPVVFEVVSLENQGKSLTMQALPPFIYLLKLPSFTQQMHLWEFEHLVTIRRTAVFVPWRGGRLK